MGLGVGVEVVLVEVVVAAHEEEVAKGEEGDDEGEVEVVVEGEEDEAGGNGELQERVDGGDYGVGHLQFVGHELVGVFAVGLTEVFVQHDAVDYREDGVGAVDSKEDDVGEVLRLDNQHA